MRTLLCGLESTVDSSRSIYEFMVLSEVQKPDVILKEKLLKSFRGLASSLTPENALQILTYIKLVFDSKFVKITDFSVIDFDLHDFNICDDINIIIKDFIYSNGLSFDLMCLLDKICEILEAGYKLDSNSLSVYYIESGEVIV